MSPNQGFWTENLEGTIDRLNASLLQFGTLANRPAASLAGRVYVVYGDGTAANNGRMFRDNGATWDEVIVVDSAAATPGLRTLGTTSTQGAAGNHSHNTANHALTDEASAVAADNPGGTVVDRSGSYTLTDTQAINAHDETTTKKVGALSLVVWGISNPGAGVTVKVSIEADGVERDSVTRTGSVLPYGAIHLLALVVKATANINFVTKLARSGTAGTSTVSLLSSSPSDTSATEANPKVRLAQADLGVA